MNLRNLFYKDENEEVDKNNVDDSSKKENIIKSNISYNSIGGELNKSEISNITYSDVSLDDNSFKDYFDGVYKDANIPGPDYLEYMQAIESLKELSLDDKSKFISAFAGFKTQGVTKEKLIETAQKYLEIFNSKKIKFEEHLNVKKNEEISKRENLIASYDQRNLEIDNLLKQLNEEKIKNVELSSGYKKEIINISESLDKKSNSFKIAYANIVESIKINIEKITNYL